MMIHTIALALVGAACCSAGPEIESPILATIRRTTLTIPGSGFGSPGPDAAVIAQVGEERRTIASTSPVVLLWEDDRIVLAVDDAARSGAVRVRTAEGLSRPAAVEVYQYEWFDIPPTEGTNALPLSIAVDAESQVWINQEFHREFQHFDPATGLVTGLAIPRPPDPGPFASTIFRDHRTQTSVLGEDVIVDPRGRVWFTQGGGSLYSGEHPNHSRVVCYDPDAEPGAEWRVYNMPGDWNEIIGLAWDERRGRMWVAQGSLEKGPAIASFDPERIEWDNRFDFSRSLLHQVCEEGQPTDDCYRVYRLPEGSKHPAHLLVDRRGLVWYTAFWGNRIGVLHPETGRVFEYPLPRAIGLGDPVWIVGSGPWQILETPGGDIVFNEYFDSTIGRFSAARILDPACRSLNGEGRNACISEWIVPGADLRNQTLHSIAFDAQNRLWFTQDATKDTATDASLGFITADGRHVVRLPSLADFPANAVNASTGIAIDRASGDIYFCEFQRKRLGRLRLVE